MRSSAGSRSITARATVRPPKPLSNIPIGRSSTAAHGTRRAARRRAPARRPGASRRPPLQPSGVRRAVGRWHARPMDLLEGLATTRAIRRYADTPVTDEELATVLWSATRAPSGSNRQPFRFVVLRDGPRAAAARAALGRAAHRMWTGKQASDGYATGSG